MTETYDYWLKQYNGKLGLHAISQYESVCITEKYIDFYKMDWDGLADSHRWDGPNHISIYGRKHFCFYGTIVAIHNLDSGWRGKFYDWTIEQGIDIDNLTDEDVTLIKLVWTGYEY